MPRDDVAAAEAAGWGDGAAPPAPAMGRRRAVFFALVAATIVVLAGLFVRVAAGAGLGWLELGLVVLFVLTLPWLVIGFWNSAIGGWLLISDRRWLPRVVPLAWPPAGRPLTTRTAIVVPIHEEDPDQVFRHLRTTIGSLQACGDAAAFEVFVLSDTRTPALARREEAHVERWRREAGKDALPPLHYRRRADNVGFKAGNIADFCRSHGDAFDFMIVLDADSVMTGRAMVRLVGLMEANAGLGILQTLVVGLPSESAFARLFQFGMRHGMRAHTVGSAWWQGDCGPYWGHNAIVRLAPFIAHCRLPMLPGGPPLGGRVLSHDQVEAVLMRRAGYAVRVLPLEDGSWEANPPTLPDFAKRDLRWCHGNMQYLRLRLPGLHRLGRLQLLLAVLMYTGSPVWLAFLALGTLMLVTGPGAALPLPAAMTSAPAPGLGLVVFAAVVGMALAPKLCGLAFAFASPRQRRAFGGGARLAAGAATEFAFSTLLAPLMSVAHSLFIAGLAVRRPLEWRRQRRAGRAVGWWEALAQLWPQTLLGLAWLLLLALLAPPLVAWAAPVLAGLILAVPFAVGTASRGVGRRLARLRLAVTPEELRPPAEVAAVCPWLRPQPAPPPAAEPVAPPASRVVSGQ